MKSQENIRAHLLKMAETSRALTGYVEHLSYEAFRLDMKTIDAVMMRVVSIGELVNRLQEYAPDFLAANPQIPWNRIRGMRNRIAHDYFGLDIRRLFETSTVFVPQLIDMVDELLNSFQ